MDPNEINLQQQIQAPALVFNLDEKVGIDGRPPSSNPMVTMAGIETTAKTEMSAAPTDVWTTPTSQGGRPRPATIYEGFTFCAGDEFGSMPSWETSSGLTMHTPSDTMSRPVSMHQNFYPGLAMENGSWGSKPCEDSLEVHHLDTDMAIGQAFTTDEAIPILDLRYSNSQVDNEPLNFESGLKPRRMSGSSFTMSTTGLSDMPSYEDFSAALSEAPSFSSDYPPPSNRNSLMSSTQLSPVASPRMTPQSRSELVRAQSRGRGASPSPRPGMRSAPYNVDNSSRNKRWSTGSYGTTPNRRPPFVFHHTHDAFGGRMPSRHSSPTISNNPLPLNFGNLQAVQQYPYLVSHAPAFRNGMILPSQLPPHLPSNGFHPEPHHYENPPPLMSHGLFRMLQSNADPHSLHGHYTDLSDPPDLYSSLQEEQIPPPPEDMNPSDPDLVPHEQELRFEGDLYTPRWVRGHGNKREGWCGICKPGRWLVLKNSAFWYDKSFTHGISAATGNPFQEPQETRRMDGSPDVWEGLCGSCNDWIALVSSKKKGTTWFRHAYKCHTHPKIKDAPKRRRESSHSRALATSQVPKPRPEQQRPVTPQNASGSVSMATTPTPASVLPIVRHSTPRQNDKTPSQKKFLVPDANNMI
ncbi:hypothetical protein GQX73_g3284 [Xylaria multiplex]|uniref:Transcription regulator Rua1 C-terminal domain-containing protein n=1 Tax=Xylaria multiplex TaxID=323545 RepID=A0A7C8IUI9_9PEZI|nr:hypothetical protein GQX73_g3284 [Xylaria multiplex]